MTLPRLNHLLLAFSLILFSSSLLFAQSELLFAKESDWPGFGGPNRNHVVNDAGLLETGKQYQFKVAWRQPIGSGYSGIAVKNDMVITMFSDNKDDYVIALNSRDGSERWRFTIDSTYKGYFGSVNGPISTPLATDKSVFILDPRGKLYSLSASSGEKQWMIDLVEDYQSVKPFYGFTTSPLAYNNMLIVETGGTDGRAISALKMDTGEVIWSAGSDTVEYQSPIIATVDGREQLIVWVNRKLIGMQPASGEIIWEFDHSGTLHPMGTSGMPVEVAEGRFYLKNSHQSGTLASVSATNEQYVAEKVWDTRHLKGSYVVPVYAEGKIIGYNSRILSSVDAETGERLWRSRKPGDGFPIILDNHLIIVTKSGTLSMAPVSSEGYNEMASLKLFDDLSWAPASYANGKLYLRSMSEIACVEIVPAAEVVAGDGPQPGIVPHSAFAEFIEKVNAATDKAALIDEYIAGQKSFPVIEGDSLVHFIYVGEANDMALESDLLGWRFDRGMHRIEDTNLFYYSSPVEADARLNYKFIKNLQQPIRDSLNTNIAFDFRGTEESWFAMPKWQSPSYLEVPTHNQRGRIDTLVFESDSLDGSKKIPVYLPHGYDESDARYPVIYLHGAFGATQMGAIDNTLDNLIGKSVRPVIVAMLPALNRGGYGDYFMRREKYTQIFVNEMMPQIEAKYRTLGTADGRANMGGLFAGYAAAYVGLNHPEKFSKLIVQSIFGDPKTPDANDAMLKNAAGHNLQIYFDWGKYDLRSPLEGGIDMALSGRQFAEQLAAHGFQFSGGEVNDGIGWNNWKHRTGTILETMFPLKDTE